MLTVLFLAFIFGLIVGSFLNVCIARLPHEESIITPRSHCPHCSAKIRALDNIPLLSYVILRGRCRSCHARISWIYPAVELFTGIFFLLSVQRFALTGETLKFLLFGCALIVLMFTDIQFRLLPNEITVGGIAVGLLISLIVPLRDRSLAVLVFLISSFAPRAKELLSWSDSDFSNSVLGAVVGFGILFLVGELYYLIRRVEGMGMGDVKMMAMVGAFLGVKLTFLTIMAGSLLGSVFGILGILWQHRDLKYELPFGTFLGIAALLLSLYGDPLVRWLFP